MKWSNSGFTTAVSVPAARSATRRHRTSRPARWAQCVLTRKRLSVWFHLLVEGMGIRACERLIAPVDCVGVIRRRRIGKPNRAMICASHSERVNLSVRIFTRRLTRLTLGFSKKLANLKFAVALFIAHFNFCRVHSAHGQTPAVAAGLTDHVWTIAELLVA
jgi:hypothetical protein